MNNEKKKEFIKACQLLMVWLRDNMHPHTTVIVNSREAELVEGIAIARLYTKTEFPEEG